MAYKQQIRKNTILLVDDDVTIINLLKDILTEAGYHVVFCYNGQEALEAVKDSSPDLIVLDWNMPEMDGLSTLKALNINSLTNEIPVIMLTGVMTDPEHLKTAFEAGAFDFIRKNFDSIELLSRIRAALKFVKANQQIVQLKNNELVENALKIAKYNQYSTFFLEQINEIILTVKKGSDLYRKLDTLKKSVQTMDVTKQWEQFNEHFLSLHPDFYKILATQHPKLGPAELKLCALLKLNLSTKEIADITCLTTDTVKTARGRIRKKLELHNEDSLTSYLLQF